MAQQITLEQARMLKKMSRKEAAERIGVSQNTILNWETGKSYPSVFYIPAILKTYELQSINDLLFILPEN